MQRLQYSAFLFLSVFLLWGCSGSKEAVVHPAVGDWAWTLDTPQGVFNGSLNFIEEEGVLNGTITNDMTGTTALDKVAFNEENNLSFEFDSGQYGIMAVNLLLEGDALDGNLDMLDMAASMPFSATRQEAETE